MKISKKSLVLAAAMTGLLSGTMARVNAQDTSQPTKSTGKKVFFVPRPFGPFLVSLRCARLV